MSILIKRRRLLQAGLATGLGTLLPAGAVFAQEKRLRGAWWGSGERNERTMAVADLFREKTGVVFEGEGAGWGDYWAKLATQVAGGNPPDIMQMNYSTISEWARRDVLLPLDDYLGNGLDLSDFDQSQIVAGTVDGKFYGVSLGYSAFGIMVNSAAWQQAGVELPSMETDWDEFGRMGAEVTKALNRPNFYGLQDGSGVVAAYQNWLRQRGKELYGADGQIAYDEADASDWFALWAGLRESRACTPPDLTALDQLTIETAMITLGYAATSYGYSNQLVGYQAVNEEPIVIVPPPMLNGDKSHGLFLQSAQSFSVAKSSREPDAAVAFIDFFVHDPEAAAILGVERGMPASSTIRTLLAPKLDEASQQSAAYLELVGPTGGPLPPAPPAGATEMNAVLKRTSEEVSFGTKTPQEGGRSLVEEAARILKPAA